MGLELDRYLNYSEMVAPLFFCLYCSVSSVPTQHCTDDVIIQARDVPGYLASHVPVHVDVVGRDDCVWSVRAPAGSTIKLTLLLFKRGNVVGRLRIVNV